MDQFKIYASMYSDIGEGSVWVSGLQFEQREIVKIRNPSNGKRCYCEFLRIEENFKDLYNKTGSRRKTIGNENSIVMNEWYRTKLGVKKTQATITLKLKSPHKWNGWYYKLKACSDHPQIVVRVATNLGIISSVLGIIGVVISIS